MVYQIGDIKNKLYPIFKDAPVDRAILFGSYAKGLADDKSDVDIFIESHGRLRGLRFYGVLEDAVTALGKSVDMIESSDIRSGTAISDEILHHGVVLYER